MIFLGTNAAIANPNPFCNCDLCVKIRRRKNPYLKKRSCFMLNERVLIDFGPDLPEACLQHDVNLTELEHIFITHSHDDHLDLSNLLLLKAVRHKLDKAITMHMSVEAFAYSREFIRKMAEKEGFEAEFDSEYSGLVTFGNGNQVRFNVIVPYTATDIDGMNVFAVQSNHTTSVQNEYAFNYFITTADGTKLHYACDTGLYSKRNLEALAGAGLHILIMEATFGSRQLKEDNTHLNGEHFIRVVEMMAEHGIVTDKTCIFSTHLNQEPHFMHDDLQAYFDQNSRYKISVAYDGLVIG